MGLILNDGWFKRNDLHRAGRSWTGRWAWILIWWVITGHWPVFRWGRYTLEGSVTFFQRGLNESKQKNSIQFIFFPRQHPLLRGVRVPFLGLKPAYSGNIQCSEPSISNVSDKLGCPLNSGCPSNTFIACVYCTVLETIVLVVFLTPPDRQHDFSFHCCSGQGCYSSNLSTDNGRLIFITKLFSASTLQGLCFSYSLMTMGSELQRRKLLMQTSKSLNEHSLFSLISATGNEAEIEVRNRYFKHVATIHVWLTSSRVSIIHPWIFHYDTLELTLQTQQWPHFDVQLLYPLLSSRFSSRHMMSLNLSRTIRRCFWTAVFTSHPPLVLLFF